MRVALALTTVLIATAAARAEDPPPAIRQGIDAAIEVGYVEQNCPGYRVDHDELHKFLNARAIKPSDFNKYAEYVHGRQNATTNHVGMTQERFCDALADLYGGHGTASALISRR